MFRDTKFKSVNTSVPICIGTYGHSTDCTHTTYAVDVVHLMKSDLGQQDKVRLIRTNNADEDTRIHDREANGAGTGGSLWDLIPKHPHTFHVTQCSRKCPPLK